MKDEASRNIKLGIFVISGIALLILALYLIGSNRSIFSSTVRVSAVFYNVSGLRAGNNVRFGGIDVGTVEKINIQNDSTITVVMLIEKKVVPFIKQNAMASISTDGLMGSKIVNINSVSAIAPPIQKGDVLQSMRPIETDEMLRTLNVTNNNLVSITEDIKSITERVKKQNNLLNILTDTVAAQNISKAIAEFKMAAENTHEVAGRINNLVADIQQGKGLAGTLLTDSASNNQLKKVIGNIELISDSLATITLQLNKFTTNINDSKGLVYALSKDTTLTNDIKQSLININKSTETLNENMKAMQTNFLFRKYFRDKEKEEKSAAKDSLKKK